MFPYTHLYCTMRINKDASLWTLYGSVFPDIPMTGVISWEEMKEKTVAFSDFVKARDPQLVDFAEGLLLHEEPRGIDRFVHGPKGYAYANGEKILLEVKKDFTDKPLIVAHGFIEYAVEMLVTKEDRSLLSKMEETLKSTSLQRGALVSVFSDFFRKPVNEVDSAIAKFNKEIRAECLGDRSGSIEYYGRLMQEYRHVQVSRERIGQLLNLAIKTVLPSYKTALMNMIYQCQIQ